MNTYIERSTYTDKIISHLLSCRSTKIRYEILKDLVEKREKNEIKKFRQSLYRLKTKGFIKISGDQIIFNNKKYIEENKTSTFFKKRGKNWRGDDYV